MIWAVCGGLVVSMFSSVTTGFAEEVVNQVNETILGLPSNDHTIQVPHSDPNIVADQNDHLPKFTGFQSEETKIHTSKEIQPKVNSKVAKSLIVDTAKKKDVYNLSPDQIESLITKGYSIDDLYQVDELSNRFLMDPQTLIERKEATEADWATLKKVLQKENDEQNLLELKEKYPEEFKQLEQESLKAQEKILLLSLYEQGKGTLAQLLQQYKTNGEKGVINYKSIEQKSAASKSFKLNTNAVPEDVLANLKEISQNTGEPLNELISKYNIAKELSKQVLVEKE